jgi:uncharacterized protein (TIGR02996 family)
VSQDPADQFLQRLAERPFDRSLRLVFADWLLEQNDPRGEVIALSERGGLSLTERRRVARLTEQHAARWLGPLAALADPANTKFEGGFLSSLVCRAPDREATWLACAGDLRLATLTRLVLPTGREAREVVGFLQHPILKHVKRLQASSIAWSLLEREPPPAFTLDTVAVASWGVFAGELLPVLHVPLVKSVRQLELVTSEFVNPLVVGELRRSLAATTQAASEQATGGGQDGAPPIVFDEVRLSARFGVVEGAVAWLIAAASDAPVNRWASRAWSIEFGDGVYAVTRDAERAAVLTVDLSHDDDLTGLGQRIATAASVLVQLGPAVLEAVEVLLPEGARVRASERDALRAATRRLRTVKRFSLGGTNLSP